ncbi:hypothetical protein [Micromonospora sp. WMMD710]|uniref:hypothetical protein n=1 Tax=Micromonospora sp. WMMD710 TaxID=3016085 RepID=UPI0024180EDD|nr:hypothetical protein [Micromonospora sp. WMMD710]MDG4760309.1 hypothetical protein [Micromonospora sp. WMMD710]
MTDQPDEPWRQHPSLLRVAAWIPDVDENLERWEELEQIAVQWIEEQAAADGVAPVVFYNAAKAHGGPGPVHRLASRYRFSYPLDRDRPRGALVAYHPDARSLRRAADLARGSALVVLESAMTPLAGWAAGTGAEDLSGVYPQVPALDPEAQKALDRAVFFGGRNNWTGSHEREHARKALDAVLRGGLIDVDTAVGYALAHAGVSEVGAKNLRSSLERKRR